MPARCTRLAIVLQPIWIDDISDSRSCRLGSLRETSIMKRVSVITPDPAAGAAADSTT